ncbi:MAG: curli assembly protein CsgG [Lentisphaerae bacterium]|jgi:hypothetical protein|nr:curli assembly protein CsgG [Lentisphaerota bacterium]MBT4816221.1 curli assembly protein CsgG [Lentisphaerota bacterium]MBT5610763.1 curli assembly protein CsgG [Lentisphaerota bacterium]MBT7060845.1 curli assembly protein CsgG [Lentisphaerota bacterium]MBT7841266.1 curli assembly protein CsgG [Lentisphaerota bacterium]
MKMDRIRAGLVGLIVLAGGVFFDVLAQDVYPTAILPFQERGAEVRGLGPKASDILFASLVANPELYLVDREDLEKTLGEAELNLSGMVGPGQATQVGQLTGAKILVTGSVMQVGKKLFVVAKIIGTETSRVLGKSVKGDARDDLDTLVEQLAEGVSETISAKADQLVAKPVKQEDRIAALLKKLGKSKRPVLYIKVAERHVGQATIDPAAETEITLFCRETGFEVLDPEAGRRKDANVVIQGEGFSEFAMRRGNLVSVKARLEVKAIDPKTDKVIATDRQTAVVVDLTEQIAGKAALQKAAAEIAERLLPKIVEK